MASSSNNLNSSIQPTFHHFPPGIDPNSVPNITFVQADPTTFRAVVQKLTGAPSVVKPSYGEMGPRKPKFKLHERRPTATRKLEIHLSNRNTVLHSPSSARSHRNLVGENMVMVSPVSPLEFMMAARGSPRTPREEEERAIAEKGFYLHPSPFITPRGSDPPELLPLFPLHSPRDN